MAVSRFALNRFRWVNDPDDALDMAYEWEHDLELQALTADDDEGEDWTP